MVTYLLLVTSIIFVCVAFGNISKKLGIPALLIFIVLGMLFGSNGIFGIEFGNYVLTEEICTVALILIMFYGGFGTKWREAKPIASQAVALSTVGVLLTAGLVGLFCYYVLGFELLEGLLIGSVVSSTDAASVFSILKSNRLNLKNNTASLLELESGSNDPVSYMMTLFILGLMQGKLSGADMLYMVFAQLFFGISFGVLIAYAAYRVFKKKRIQSQGTEAAFLLAVALIAYAAPAYFNGNGYLSVYIVGMILGNKYLENKVALVHFFDGITGLMQMLIFFLLGLVSFPYKMPAIAGASVIIAVFLTIVARPLAVFTVLKPFGASFNQCLLVSWSGLRGAASIVFAMIAVNSVVYANDFIFHLVLVIVLCSIAIQGTLLPLFARKFDMIDDSADVFRTFTDYTDEIPVQFIKLNIGVGHRWVNRQVKSLILPPATLFVLLLRGKERILPKGDTLIQQDDILVLSAKAVKDRTEFVLTEIPITKAHEWLGCTLAEIDLETDKLVIGIKRGEEFVIPNGRTEILEGDVLLINRVLAED